MSWSAAHPRRKTPSQRDGTTIALIFALSAMTSCLLPPYTEEFVPTDNLAPRINTDTLTPEAKEGPRRMTTRCPAYLFFAQILDPDPFDTLYWRVFLDYHRQDPSNLLATEVRTSKSGTLINFSVDPNDPAFFTAGFTAVHVVELFIADRPFEENPQAPYARRVTAPGLSDSFVWALELNTTDECANAP